jgi:histidyl-tRNA synthetase
MASLKNIKGTKDLLPHDTLHWREIEYVIHEFMAVHGYGEIRTPVFESTELFKRGVGTETDIVSKEMYSWEDQGGNQLTLRPELTAPVVRAFNQHNLRHLAPINRLYYIDSLFRRERPQKGRQRQFHQFGIEAFGSEYPEQDAEVIAMAYRIFETFGIKDLHVKLNSIGSSNVRPQYLEILRSTLQGDNIELCPTCTTRLDKNALRVFDCKNPACQETLDTHAPTIFDHITDEDNTHFNRVVSLLDAMNIPFTHDKKLVRGLDYYTRTTFEITSSSLGAQDALCGGGRYDNLVEQLGGKPLPAVGFAAGLERLFIAMGDDGNHEHSQTDIYMVLLGDEAIQKGFVLADEIRQKGFRVTLETLQRSMKAQMKEANRMGAQFTVIIGENEILEGSAIIKNMENSEQTQTPFDSIASHFTLDHPEE